MKPRNLKTKGMREKRSNIEGSRKRHHQWMNQATFQGEDKSALRNLFRSHSRFMLFGCYLWVYFGVLLYFSFLTSFTIIYHKAPSIYIRHSWFHISHCTFLPPSWTLVSVLVQKWNLNNLARVVPVPSTIHIVILSSETEKQIYQEASGRSIYCDKNRQVKYGPTFYAGCHCFSMWYLGL